MEYYILHGFLKLALMSQEFPPEIQSQSSTLIREFLLASFTNKYVQGLDREFFHGIFSQIAFEMSFEICSRIRKFSGIEGFFRNIFLEFLRIVHQGSSFQKLLKGFVRNFPEFLCVENIQNKKP